MESNDLTNSLILTYKIQTRIIELQNRLIGILESGEKDPQLIESIKTLTDELKGVLK